MEDGTPDAETLEATATNVAITDAAEVRQDIVEEADATVEAALIEEAAVTRKAKGNELAERTYEQAIDRRARDTAELPASPTSADRKMRTGFALLKSNRDSKFQEYVSAVVELIEDHDGEIQALVYQRDQHTNYVSLTYNVPTKIFDLLPSAFNKLRALIQAA